MYEWLPVATKRCNDGNGERVRVFVVTCGLLLGCDCGLLRGSDAGVVAGAALFCCCCRFESINSGGGGGKRSSSTLGYCAFCKEIKTMIR